MGFQREFAEILKEKLGDQEEKTQNPPVSHPQTSPFPHWKYQFESQKRTFIPGKISQIYPRSLQKAEIKQPPQKVQKTVTKEPSYKIGELGLKYTSDLITLQSLGADLDPAQLTLTQIKKEYRRLAKQWHPDRAQGVESTQSFHLLAQAYKNLSGAILELRQK